MMAYKLFGRCDTFGLGMPTSFGFWERFGSVRYGTVRYGSLLGLYGHLMKYDNFLLALVSNHRA